MSSGYVTQITMFPGVSHNPSMVTTFTASKELVGMWNSERWSGSFNKENKMFCASWCCRKVSLIVTASAKYMGKLFPIRNGSSWKKSIDVELHLYTALYNKLQLRSCNSGSYEYSCTAFM